MGKYVRRFSWSYSRWSCFNKCPSQYNYRVNLKLEEPKVYAMERGNLTHAKCESFINGNIPRPTKDMWAFKDEFLILKSVPEVQAELDLSVTASWGKSFATDWDNVWCRMKLDAVVPPMSSGEGLSIDYKTGRKYETHKDQNKLYATGMFAHFDRLEVLYTEMWYLDENDILVQEWNRDQFSELKKYWEGEALVMAAEKKFEPKPGNHCQWCHFANSKGGPCDEG